MTLETLVEADPVSTPSPGRASRSARRARPRILVVGGLLVVAVVVALVLRHSGATAARKKPSAPRPVPVVTAQARLGEMGLYLSGLGTVAAVTTVTVRSRVDGEIERVAYREGQLVKQGDLLAQIDSRPFQVQLLQARGQQAKDEATLENARLDLKRYQALVAEDSIARQQLDTQLATVHQLEATLESDRAQVESAKLSLTYSRITAPTTGRVGLRLVDPGNIVHPSDPNGIVVITQQEPIAVVFTIPADQLPPVMAKMQAGSSLRVEAWDRELKTKLATGTLEAVDNQIDPTTGTVRLKGLFPNLDHALFSNQFVNARLLVDTLRGVVLIPTAALEHGPRATYAWVVKPDSTVEMRELVVQHSEGELSAIERGVSVGEAVVTEGGDNVQPGTKVETGPAR